jgi:hypothetical protein
MLICKLSCRVLQDIPSASCARAIQPKGESLKVDKPPSPSTGKPLQRHRIPQAQRVVHPQPALSRLDSGLMVDKIRWRPIRTEVREATATIFTCCRVPIGQPRLHSGWVPHQSIHVGSYEYPSQTIIDQCSLLQHAEYLWAYRHKFPYSLLPSYLRA